MTSLVKSRDYESWRAAADSGEYSHIVSIEGEDFSVTCGTMRYVMSLPADYAREDGYPFLTAPWLLPHTKGEDGKYKLNRVEITSRSHYKQVLRKHGMIEPETASDRLTMYSKTGPSTEDKLNKEVAEDVKFYHEMKRNPGAARRIINESVAQKKAAGL